MLALPVTLLLSANGYMNFAAKKSGAHKNAASQLIVAQFSYDVTLVRSVNQAVG